MGCNWIYVFRSTSHLVSDDVDDVTRVYDLSCASICDTIRKQSVKHVTFMMNRKTPLTFCGLWPETGFIDIATSRTFTFRWR